MTFDLKFHTHRLLRKEPFFAAFSRRVDKVADYSIPTAAIGYDRKTYRFTLFYNPDFMESLTDDEKVGVLKHEFYHLILGHLNGRIPFDREKESHLMRLWNVASDLAINSHLIGELPKMACIPGVPPFQEYPTNGTAEFYFKRLQEDKQEQQGPYQGGAEGPDSMDDHSILDGSEEVSDIFNEKVKEMVKESTKKADASGWGSVSREIRKTLRKMVSPTISPERVLRYFIRTTVNSHKVSTWHRPDKRLLTQGIYMPGRKSEKVANIAVSIDQSGSVSDGMLETFFSFLNNLGSIATFTVIPFDHTVCVDSIYVWKKGEKREWRRVRYGGTNFDAPTRWVNKRNFDGHIIITDMQARKPIASKCQRLWITNSRNKNYPHFRTNEKVLAIDV